ncbi:uncharacterized protein NEMAJ01_0080 [Nematocida major]|uniref:uncharacterized protein n=1 Tax=Nematocida major TaxID=1912982 RepID=UPI0020089259|nr:uncharacterized protein NEMAJ01_0080 [Nematocida major]KAH9385184.1 hypothetical protein NEMAJ01_0080 [Nematocida major]
MDSFPNEHAGALHSMQEKSPETARAREYLYNGETVWVEGLFDGIKVSTYSIGLHEKSPEKGKECCSASTSAGECTDSVGPSSSECTEPGLLSCEYIGGSRAYYISSASQAVRFDYLEFLRKPECPEKYCISNVINSTEEVVLKSETFSVVPPFQIVERIQGNYIYATLVPDRFLSPEARSTSVVSVNGVRMKYDGSSYKAKLLQIRDWSTPLHISVDFGQIQYSRPSSIHLPSEFMYSIGIKQIGNQHFAKLVLSRTTASSYEILILNPLISQDPSVRSPVLHNAGSNTSVVKISPEVSVDISALDLMVGAASSDITIESPDAVTEILFKLEKRPPARQQYLLAMQVNSYPIEFCVKM